MDPGMAFVLVQHLSPKHKSILPDIIQGYTHMKVFQAEDGMTVMPNCIYIIPPNRDLAILNGALHLYEIPEPRSLHLPIDFFFRSLAKDQRGRAVCIVLSGTGGDGTQGVREIKGQGGMVIVQEPNSAEHDGMPRGAMDTGMVDFVLPVDEIPGHLIEYVTHAFGEQKAIVTDLSPKTDNALKKFSFCFAPTVAMIFLNIRPALYTAGSKGAWPLTISRA